MNRSAIVVCDCRSEVVPNYGINGEWLLFRPIRQLEVLTSRLAKHLLR